MSTLYQIALHADMKNSAKDDRDVTFYFQNRRGAVSLRHKFQSVY